LEVSPTEDGGTPAEPAPAPEQPVPWLETMTRRLGFATRDGVRVAQVEAVATLLLVSLGLFMRFTGVVFGEPMGFWNDEANWAIRVVEQPLKDLLIRPIGFMLLTRWSVALLGKWEFAFRLIPWLAGIATPLIAVLLARRFLSRPAARLLFIGILCLSCTAIDFSKEFKPYGVSLMLHLLLPLLALRWAQTRRMRDLVLVGMTAPLAVFFAQDIIFLYPGLFLVLAIETYRSRNFRQLGAAIGFAALTAGTVLGMYVLIWSRLPKNESEYWGGKYGVFYRPKDPSDSALAWYADKYAGAAELPGDRRRLFQPTLVSPEMLGPLQRLDELAWLALHIAGLALMAIQRRYREALLFLTPTLVSAVFNRLGYWPFGVFRTNVFLLAGMSAIASLGLDFRVATKRAWAVLVPVALFMLAPMAVAKNEWGFTKQLVSYSQMPLMIDRLLALPETQNIKREPFFLDHHSFNIFRYYVNHHARSPEWKKPVKAKFNWQYRKRENDVYKAVRRLRPGQRGWIMLRDGHPPAEIKPRLMLDLGDYQLYTVQAPERS
jgi:hypothetical protein